MAEESISESGTSEAGSGVGSRRTAANAERDNVFNRTNADVGVDEAWAMGERGGYEAACLPNWGGHGTCTRHFGPPAVGGEQIIKDTIAACWRVR